MKKFIILLFAMFVCVTLVNGETAEEARARFIEMKIEPAEVERLYKEIKAKEKRDIEFKNWLKNDDNLKDCYYIPIDTIIGMDECRDKYIKVFNRIQNNGGEFNVSSIRSLGGLWVRQGWCIARIIKRFKGSNVVKIQYICPFVGKNVYEGWIHLWTMTPWLDKMKDFAK